MINLGCKKRPQTWKWRRQIPWEGLEGENGIIIIISKKFNVPFLKVASFQPLLILFHWAGTQGLLCHYWQTLCKSTGWIPGYQNKTSCSTVSVIIVSTKDLSFCDLIQSSQFKYSWENGLRKEGEEGKETCWFSTGGREKMKAGMSQHTPAASHFYTKPALVVPLTIWALLAWKKQTTIVVQEPKLPWQVKGFTSSNSRDTFSFIFVCFLLWVKTLSLPMKLHCSKHYKTHFCPKAKLISQLSWTLIRWRFFFSFSLFLMHT